MSQNDIIELLKKHPERWFIIKEIAELTGISCSTASEGLRKLFKQGEVLRKQTICETTKREISPYLWKFKD